eukprot:CAMPEP_0116899848 /NCGR_PEP_ID=MMETSP0467-20121206/8326_1 /TAXON_ID=283647 /ORGANISM="Mesodinium pulex, Strain SPMC105" /LENGTH=55 /DNA_ID=CAMNT_0004572897 /DNA_START=1764 /DNA_END=1931 /DNA_ORIENTATION=+
MIIQKNLSRIHTILKNHEEKKFETKLDKLSKKENKPEENAKMEDVVEDKNTSFED